ncbi:MAG: fatty acid kinase, partial [Actinomycetota bacterium]|nr:fatty acid kinase [Actinomycetota bacterium]
MSSERFDPPTLRAWVIAGLQGLADAREEIDDLNVYPVPDGDTGTNMHLTVAAAAEGLDDLPADADLATLLSALSRAALLGARGNSGVILSQMFKGFADGLADLTGDPPEVAAALHAAADAAYAAVGDPVEGTMLSVLKAGAEAGAAAADGGLAALVTAVAQAAREALGRTTEQLEALRAAGVVDAGGRGVCVLLDALEGVVTGSARQSGHAAPRRERAARSSEDVSFNGPAYE